MSRTARIERTTSESSVVVEIDLDGTGRTDIDCWFGCRRGGVGVCWGGFAICRRGFAAGCHR